MAVEFKRAGFLTKIVVLVLLIYMAVTLLELRGRIQALQEKGDSLADLVNDQRWENRKLEDAIANSSDPEMLEQVARDRGYVEQNEILFVDVAN